MMYFLTDNNKIDLSHISFSFNEESNFFTNDTLQNYSEPIIVGIDSELSIALGLPSFRNISNVNSRIEGIFVLANNNYRAYLELGDIRNNEIELTLFYGEETLNIYNRNLSELDWRLINAQNLISHAKEVSSKSWPEASHAFPMVFNNQIGKENDYEDFEFFINHYKNGDYIENETIEANNETKFINRNVMAPFVYLLEILKQGFALEQKVIRGNFVNHPLIKKSVLAPKSYFEEFTSIDTFSFNFESSEARPSLGNLVFFKKEVVLNRLGNYELKVKFNFPISLSKSFNFSIELVNGEKRKEVFKRTSSDTPVNIDENLTVEVDDNFVFGNIEFFLRILDSNEEIKDFNFIDFSFSAGRQNIFPTVFSLSEVMPDMTFGDYVNELKNTFNLDIDTREDVVYLDFTNESFNKFPLINMSEFEEHNPLKKFNTDRIYKLSNEIENPIYINNKGIMTENPSKKEGVEELKLLFHQIPSNNFKETNTIELDLESDGLGICIYNGFHNDSPLPLPALDGVDLKLNNLYQYFWKDWLFFRTNSVTVKDNYTAHAIRNLNFRQSIFKYNEKVLLAKKSMTNISEDYWDFECEYETI